MSKLAKREHIAALKNNDAMKTAVVTLSDGIEEIACCDLHKLALANVIFTGLLRTLGLPEAECLRIVKLLDNDLEQMANKVPSTSH